MAYQSSEIILKKYRVESLIGQGAFAEVYRAVHLELNAPRALKILRKDAPGLGSTEYGDYQMRFQLEAQLGAKLNHPNIIGVHDFERDGKDLILVMEFAAGGNLGKLIEQARQNGNPIPLEKAISIALEVADGLSALHAMDVVHRDLKPSNILFDAKGHAKVADLGLAQVPGGPSMRSQLSMPAPHPGTSAYMSPEQRISGDYLTSASDVYALGLVLFEILTGRVYRGQRPGTRASSLRADIPEWIDDLLVRMLLENTDGRPWDGKEVADQLRTGFQVIEEQQKSRQALAETKERARQDKLGKARQLAKQKTKERTAAREKAERETSEQKAKEHQAARKKNEPAKSTWITYGIIAAGVIGLVLCGLAGAIFFPALLNGTSAAAPTTQSALTAPTRIMLSPIEASLVGNWLWFKDCSMTRSTLVLNADHTFQVNSGEVGTWKTSGNVSNLTISLTMKNGFIYEGDVSPGLTAINAEVANGILPTSGACWYAYKQSENVSGTSTEVSPATNSLNATTIVSMSTNSPIEASLVGNWLWFKDCSMTRSTLVLNADHTFQVNSGEVGTWKTSGNVSNLTISLTMKNGFIYEGDVSPGLTAINAEVANGILPTSGACWYAYKQP